MIVGVAVECYVVVVVVVGIHTHFIIGIADIYKNMFRYIVITIDVVIDIINVDVITTVVDVVGGVYVHCITIACVCCVVIVVTTSVVNDVRCSISIVVTIISSCVV